jgi:hypothetical protein
MSNKNGAVGLPCTLFVFYIVICLFSHVLCDRKGCYFWRWGYGDRDWDVTHITDVCHSNFFVYGGDETKALSNLDTLLPDCKLLLHSRGL